MKKIFSGIGNIIYLAKPYWKYGKLYMVGRIVIEIIIAPALALLQVRLIQSIIDAITAGASLVETVWTAATLVGSIFGLTVLRWTFLLLYDRWKVVEIQNKINRGIYEQAIFTDYKYFDNPDFYNSFTFAIGELAAKSESALQLLTQILGIISVIIAMMAYLSVLGPWVILISIIGQAICLYAQRHMQKLGIKKTAESLPFDRKLQYVHRIAYQKQYAADMKSTNLSQKILALFDKGSDGKIAVFRKLATPNWRWNMLQFTAWHLCQFAQLAYMISCIFIRNLGIGTIAGMFAASGRLNDMLNQFVGISGKAMEVSLYADRIRSFFDLHSDIETMKNGIAPPAGAFALDIHNASFTYPNSDFALRNINISVKPGDKIAIVGENGAGKTTLAKLLLRLYDSNGGDIFYNDVSVREYDIHELRRRIGVAFQDPQLYALTVRENMEMYNSADDMELYKTLKKAGLDIALDNEVTREFNDNGVILSGGQAQKLGLTRLLHGEFGLLLLDEPSSALDPLAEYKMTKLIFEQSNTTTIMVAHRLSTIRYADNIFLIADGGVVESGTHDKLMTIGGRYAEMFSKQAENYVK